MHSPNELVAAHSHSGLLRKNKMLGAVKTQMNEMEAYKHKKTKKSSKISREGHSFEKDRSMPEVTPFTDNKNKRKKNTRSEVEMLAEKYPIRFNTEASEKDDWEPKLKKSHMNSKILGFSRSAIRLPKGGKVDRRC